MKLLITSVGSLLGQNILDSIESRRNMLNVVGIDASAENPRNFRCDTVYLIHKSDSPHFETDFNEIIEKEKPDFILPGRDGDSIFLADLKSKYPEKFANKIPFGSSYIPSIMLDKHKSSEFCKKNQLPFADTLFYNNESDKAVLNTFIDKHGFPLVVKPREGFGSHSVYYVLNHEQVNEKLKEESYNPDGLVQRTIRAIKSAVPELLIISDVALELHHHAPEQSTSQSTTLSQTPLVSVKEPK